MKLQHITKTEKGYVWYKLIDKKKLLRTIPPPSREGYGYFFIFGRERAVVTDEIPGAQMVKVKIAQWI